MGIHQEADDIVAAQAGPFAASALNEPRLRAGIQAVAVLSAASKAAFAKLLAGGVAGGIHEAPLTFWLLGQIDAETRRMAGDASVRDTAFRSLCESLNKAVEDYRNKSGDPS